MSTAAEIACITEILTKIYRPIIVELGAYTGEDSQWMRQACGDNHTINVMVEPDARNYAQLVARGGHKTISLLGAISDHTGECEFYGGSNRGMPAGQSASGSIRRPTGHVETFPDITFPDSLKTKVRCWKLDDIAAELGITEVDLLWADIQGAERDMIAGGARTLARTRYLFIEAEEQEFYEGQAIRPDLLAMLPAFKVIAEFDYNLLLGNKAMDLPVTSWVNL